MASNYNSTSSTADDEKDRKHRQKKKMKSQPLAPTNAMPVSGISNYSTKSPKQNSKKLSVGMGYDEENKPPAHEKQTISTLPPVSCDEKELCSPVTGRRPSQPLLTIAEEEETAVDPARRGSERESRDDDDDKSTGDTTDMFEDVRRRRYDQKLNRVEDDDNDVDETAMTMTDQRDTESDAGSLEYSEGREQNDDAETGFNQYGDKRKEQLSAKQVVWTKQNKENEGSHSTNADHKQTKSDGRRVADKLKSSSKGDDGTQAPSSRGHEHRHKHTVRTQLPAPAVDISNDRKESWFAAVTRGDIAAVEKMASKLREIVNIIDEHGRTALHIAAEIRNVGMVDWLVKAGAWLDVQSIDSETPLHIAARTLDRTVASRLLTAGADPNSAGNSDGTTPLHVACQHSDGSRMTRLLLNRGARPDPGRRSRSGLVSGIAPLHDAADSGDVRSVRALLDADPTLTACAVTDRGCTALHVAARHGRQDVLGELIGRSGSGSGIVNRAGSDSKGAGVLPLHMAAENGRAEAVKTLIEAGTEINAGRDYGGKTGITALHLAVMRSHKDVVTVLLAAGASVNVVDSDGTTPLHLAARNGLCDMVSALIERGASINAGTRAQNHGRISVGGITKTTAALNQTPLHFAVRYRHADVVKLLLKAGIDVNAAEKMFGEPRSSVNSKGIGERQEGQVINDLDVWSESRGLVDSYTSLHWAVENGDLAMVRLLLDAGADVNRRASFDSHSGVTPLHLAAQDGYADIADELLRRNADRDPRKRTKNRDNVTPLHQAAYNGHPATVAALVRAGCDVNIQADNGYAALHYAAQRGSIEITRTLLAAGRNDSSKSVGTGDGGNRQRTVNLNLLAWVKDQMDITPLHLAVQSGSVDVVRALVEAGAPIDAGKRTVGGIGGVTPLHQAVYQLHDDIVELLLQLGANPNRSMDGWYRPLHIAAEKSSAAIASYLIKAGAEVDARASIGDHVDLTPLHVAAQHGHSPVVRVLAQAGADLSAVRKFADRSGITALHLAAENGFADTIRLLLDLVSAKFAATNSAATAASDPSTSVRVKPSQSVLTYVNNQDSLRFTALHLAVQYQFVDVVRILLTAGADVALKTVSGLTALKLANHLPNLVIREMLRAAANPSSSRSAAPSGSSKNDRHHQKSGKLRSLLCGVNKK